MAEKINFAKEYKQYYTAKNTPVIVEFGQIPYLTLEGKGEPAGDVFSKSIKVLYPLAYGVKNICKKERQDFGVPKLEGLWWVKSNKPALEVSRSEWYCSHCISCVSAGDVIKSRPIPTINPKI